MGGGGVMRAAAKAAGGFGVFRGTSPAVSPAEHAVATAARKGTRAVSVASSTDEATWTPLTTASQNNSIDAGTQRPSWELDEWEFAGSEEEVIVKPPEPMPRLVFGCVPTLEEAKEATSELKDALDKIYLSSHVAAECGESHDCALSLLSNLNTLRLNHVLSVRLQQCQCQRMLLKHLRFSMKALWLSLLLLQLPVILMYGML